MKFSMRFIFLINIYMLPKTYSQGSQKVPGSASVTYFGSLKEECKLPTVPAADLPKEATSLFYVGIYADASFNVAFIDGNKSNDEYLKDLLSTGKPVFLCYGHTDAKELITVISSNSQDGGKNAKTEMSNLKKFIEPYKSIKGIGIRALTSSANDTTTPCLTENFKIYLGEMKSTFPDYGIGLMIKGNYLIDMFTESKTPVWFDFRVLDPIVDFYIISVYFMNENCTEELKHGGSIPISGKAPKTLEKVLNITTQLGIPKEKTYFLYRASPTTNNFDLSTCEVTNEKFCAKPNGDGYCSDNIHSYHEKGAFTKQNGVGFVVYEVDLDDDPHGCCQCGTPYPAFHSILAGFNGDPDPPKCPLLDKN